MPTAEKTHQINSIRNVFSPFIPDVPLEKSTLGFMEKPPLPRNSNVQNIWRKTLTLKKTGKTIRLCQVSCVKMFELLCRFNVVGKNPWTERLVKVNCVSHLQRQSHGITCNPGLPSYIARCGSRLCTSWVCSFIRQFAYPSQRKFVCLCMRQLFRFTFSSVPWPSFAIFFPISTKTNVHTFSNNN